MASPAGFDVMEFSGVKGHRDKSRLERVYRRAVSLGRPRRIWALGFSRGVGRLMGTVG